MLKVQATSFKKNLDALDFSILREYMEGTTSKVAKLYLASRPFLTEEEDDLMYSEVVRLKHITETLRQTEVRTYREDDLKMSIREEQDCPF